MQSDLRRGLIIMKRHLLAFTASTVLTLASVISIARGAEVAADAVLRH